MGTIASRDCLRVLDLTDQVLAAMLIAVRQGITLRDTHGALHLTTPVGDFMAMLDAQIPFVGEDRALEMIVRHPPKLLALVVLMSMSKTAMANVTPPSLSEIGAFFQKTRKALPSTPVMLGCARPMGDMKVEIDRLAVDAGLNGIAFPANDIVEYARQAGLRPQFVNACCGVTW